jgi:hypothetical protein
MVLHRAAFEYLNQQAKRDGCLGQIAVGCAPL